LWKLALGSSLFVEVGAWIFVEVDTSTLMLIGVFSIDVFVVVHIAASTFFVDRP
jgi:hypothetical protein